MTTPVYKNYSQAELDLQYNTHRLVPEVSAYRTKWSQSSAQVRRTHPNCVIDVPYGNLPAERLDIFPPRASAATPYACAHPTP